MKKTPFIKSSTSISKRSLIKSAGAVADQLFIEIARNAFFSRGSSDFYLSRVSIGK